MTETLEAPEPPRGAAGGGDALVLVVAWAGDEPGRVGEVLIPPARDGVVRVGRGTGEGPTPRLAPVQLRPGVVRQGAPLGSARLSRDQLEVEVSDGVARLRNVGRGSLWHDGRAVDEVALAPGQVIEVDQRLSLFVEQRPVALEGWPGRSDHPFGGPDADGLVGESAAAWEVRRQLDFLGPRRPHVLVRGPSGAGKELAADGLHRRSDRRGPLVSRNATTLPEGLVDAELFGNVRGYPNPGMAARPGLVGAADRGTLFLDEIGDLPEAVQPHLLRLLDHGEYHVLGDDRPRRADLRLIGATHRPAEALRHDLLARFPLRLELPGLDARRADLPLLARHLLRRTLDREPDLRARFVDADGEPRIGQALVRHLLLRSWTTHVRELDGVLWSALQASRGAVVDALPEPLPAAPASAPQVDWRSWVGRGPEGMPKAVVEAALAAHNGHLEQTAAALGLSSRFVLSRLVKRHGLAVVRQR
jgi:two-component system nitrogen regulation response regulator GlnG/two-component system response regulator HydG